VTATLLIAAHGTRSEEGTATTRALVDAVAAQRPSVPVELCFLDVAAPSLADALDTRACVDVVIVPLLLSAGYHVQTDIPEIVRGRSGVRVAAHLGPDPAIVTALADRLAAAGASKAASVALAAVTSSRSQAQRDVDQAATLLGERIGRHVSVLSLAGDIAAGVSDLAPPVAVSTYLLAPGEFLASVREAVAGRGALAEPIGVHPALVDLVWTRYDAALEPAKAPDEVR
jgi:sirohydrochlorin ferrochelatase